MAKKTPLIKRPIFAKVYGGFGLFTLLATSTWWAVLSSKVQLANSDQLVYSFLMENAATFRGAILPGAHAFLLKWPLFFAVKLFGATNNAFIVFTVLTVLLTVGLLALLITRIEKRPIVLGTIFLALSSVLLLVPTFSYPGNSLPVNMAMLATRNLEYIVFVYSLLMIIQHPRIKDWQFWLGSGFLAVLIASDHLFLPLSIGAAAAGMVVYASLRQWQLVTHMTHWILAGITATAMSVGLGWLVMSTGVTLSNQVDAGPYGVINNASNLFHGIAYSITGLLSNFGANPAQTSVLKDYPSEVLHKVLDIHHLSGPAYVVNGMIMLFALYTMFMIVKPTLVYARRKMPNFGDKQILAVALTLASFTSLGIFVLTDHYYAADARYLTIWLFAATVSAAVYFSKKKKISVTPLVIAGAVFTVSILLGIYGSSGLYNQDQRVLSSTNRRNNRIAQVLEQHPVNTVVGDYWRVLPTKLQSKGNIKVMPLANCTETRDTLTSKEWNEDLNKHSFAYLISQDKGLTDYPHCDLNKIVAKYGRPNASTLIDGTLSKPKEQLLFFDNGAHKSSPTTPQPAAGPSTVVPTSLDDLPNTTCTGPTTMTVVAHQDDDLLFTNPDLLNKIKAGHCVRTVYVTAGDDGQGEFYWIGREKGSQAAYAAMTGDNSIWIERIVKLDNGQFVTVANPRGNKKVSLIFLRLPDGNTKGQGFEATNFENLQGLENGSLESIHAIDGQSTYTANQFTQALSQLMHAFQPSELNTQADDSGVGDISDHSDHVAVGKFVKRGYEQYEKVPLHFYMGYPVHSFVPNVSGEELTLKQNAFFAYAKFDQSVCGSVEACQNDSVYNYYLERQYTQDH